MNCYGCQELLITPRQRAVDCEECIEQYLNNKFQISQGNFLFVVRFLLWDYNGRNLYYYYYYCYGSQSCIDFFGNRSGGPRIERDRGDAGSVRNR